MSTSTCPRCPATWTGLRIQHCTACHETFTGTASGDMHRVGRYDTTAGPDRRRCLTTEEMGDKGMTLNKRGQWTTGAPSPEFWVEDGAA